MRAFQENFLEKSIKYKPKDVIQVCKEAHQRGSDLIICNLMCLISDLKQKGYDERTLKEFDKFVERFK